MRRELFNLKNKLHSSAIARFARELRQNESLSFEELAELNWQRRRALVAFAFEKIPFYRRKYREAGFEIGDLKTPSDFSRLPVLEKSEIRLHRDELVNPAYSIEKLPVATTGGSTGIPLQTYLDPGVPLAVISWRMLNWWGVEPSDSSAYLYRAVPHGMKKFVQQLLLYPTYRCWLAANQMTENNMRNFVNAMKRHRVRYLVAYVGAAGILADYMEKADAHLSDLRAVWTTSSPLPEHTRLRLEKVFGAPVYTQYGSCEFYWLAAECREKHGMHIGTDIRHIDIVDSQDGTPCRTGEWGDILATDLCNHAFPLIRYRLGDRGRLLSERCRCGLPFPLMDYVRGRVSDNFELPSGIRIPGEFMTTLFDEDSEVIEAFQFRQLRSGEIVLRYKAISGREKDARIAVERARTNFCTVYPECEKLLSVSEEEININDNGKIRFIIREQ